MFVTVLDRLKFLIDVLDEVETSAQKSVKIVGLLNVTVVAAVTAGVAGRVSLQRDSPPHRVSLLDPDSFLSPEGGGDSRDCRGGRCLLCCWLSFS